MALVRIRDLGIQLLPDGSFLVRAPGRGIGARMPFPAIELLSFCTTPRSRDDIAARYGKVGTNLYDGLAQVGLLVDPAAAADAPVLFENYAAIDVHRRMLGDEPR